jgi:hypothetical protein
MRDPALGVTGLPPRAMRGLGPATEEGLDHRWANDRPVLPNDRPDTGDPSLGTGPGVGTGALIIVTGAGAAFGASKTDSAAPYLALTGALLVALITWYATDRRQAQMLRADERRQQRQLDHDRALDDRQELRKFLDSVAETYEDLHHAFTQLIVVLRERPFATGGAIPKLDAMEASAHDGVTQGLLAVGRMGRRLGLRFPDDHGLLVALLSAAGELNAGLKSFSDLGRDPVSRLSEMERRAQNALDAFRKFGEAARSVFE